MSKTLKNLMVVLVAVLMFFSSAFTPVRAEEIESDPAEEGVTEETIESGEQEKILEEDSEVEEETVAEETAAIEEATIPEETEEETVFEATEGEALDLAEVSLQELPSLNGGYTINAEGDTRDTENLKPLSTSKMLTYNEDGTYTLELSVTCDSQSSSETTTKNTTKRWAVF